MKRKVIGLVIALIGTILISVATITIICLPGSREDVVESGSKDAIYRAAEEQGYSDKDLEELFRRKNISINEAAYQVAKGSDPFQVIRLIATTPIKEYSETVQKIRHAIDIMFFSGCVILIAGLLLDDILRRRFRDKLEKELGIDKMRLIEMRNFAAFIDEGFKAGAGWNIPKFGDGWEGDNGLDEHISRILVHYARLDTGNILYELDMAIKLTDAHIRAAIEEIARKTGRENIKKVCEFIESLDDFMELREESLYSYDLDKMKLAGDILDTENELLRLHSDCFDMFKDCRYLPLESYLKLMHQDMAWDDFTSCLLNKNVESEDILGDMSSEVVQNAEEGESTKEELSATLETKQDEELAFVDDDSLGFENSNEEDSIMPTPEYGLDESDSEEAPEDDGGDGENVQDSDGIRKDGNEQQEEDNEGNHFSQRSF